MDQITQQPTQMCCKQHPQKKIEFLQVNDLSNSENQPLFYCTTCINSDLAFKGINYLLTSQIIDEGEKNIIQKWPPVNDYSLIEKLIQYSNEQDTSASTIHRINQFFTQLKEEFLRKIDLCEKKMINRALELPFGFESILKQYQDISQILKLRSILQEEDEMNTEVIEQNCRQFITQIEAQKENNTTLLQNLLEQCSNKQELVNFEYPLLIKNSIFTFIDEIDFFNSQNISNTSQNIFNTSQNISSINQSLISNQNQINESSTKSKILMKLISNKSNFCSVNFLSNMKVLLHKLSPLLETISFENIYEENRIPIDFSGLSQIRLSLIKEFVEHQKKIDKNTSYCKSIEEAIEYQMIEEVIDSKANFMNTNFKVQFKNFLVDTYPLLKQINFTNAVTERQRFDAFRSLSEEDILDLNQLIIKRKELASESEYNQSQTKRISEQIENIEELDLLCRKYPIFDLKKRRENMNEGELQEIKLVKTNMSDSQNRTHIGEEGRSVQIDLADSQDKNDSWINCVSNIILEKDKKYVFRFSIQNDNPNTTYIMLGLMQKSKKDTSLGYSQKLSCYLFHDHQKLKLIRNEGVDKNLRGEDFHISTDNQIEMRVWLGAQQLEILDYPNYQYKLGIQEQSKSNLTTFNDLQLYIGMLQTEVMVTLTTALVVQDFPEY